MITLVSVSWSWVCLTGTSDAGVSVYFDVLSAVCNSGL
jgi:hypothetical protein